MRLKKYKKDFDYSYVLGAFPSLEVARHHIDIVQGFYIASSFHNESYLSELKELAKNSNVPVYLFSDNFIERIGGKDNIYVIAVIRKYTETLDPNSHHLLLDEASNMGNLGTIIRSSLGFNITNIALIGNCVDYFDPKVIRSSMGSIFSVKIAKFKSLEEYKKSYSDHTIYSFMLQASQRLQDVKFKKGLVTLAFGNEAHGLALDYLDENALIIEHSKAIDSLNITNAVSIALYEFTKQVNA